MRASALHGLLAFAASWTAAVLCPHAAGWAQSVTDSTGDIPAGDPSYLDVSRIRVRQSTDNVQIDLYPLAAIPPGNQAGITATTVYEFYMDVDGDSATGTPIEDIGYDYKLRIDLFEWNGKSWIDGTVFWQYDRRGQWSQQAGFFVPAANLIPQRFRWEFSLISLKWPRIDWVMRVYHRDHRADQIPDRGHGSLAIDTTLVPDIRSVASEYVRIVYPATFQAILDSFDVLHTVDAGARIERDLCGTEFLSRPLGVEFSPWSNGVNYSGNPVVLGSWSWRDRPPWFMFFHEMGHNFTLAAQRFSALYPWGGYGSAGGDDWHFGTDFCEAWASMVGIFAVHEMVSAPVRHGIPGDAVRSLAEDLSAWHASYTGQLRTYEGFPDHSRLNPDLLDGIFYTLADSLGYDLFSRWFRMLRPPDDPWPALQTIRPQTDYTDAKIRSMTITAAGFSVAAKTDLRDLFKRRWDIPVDDQWYTSLLPEITRMIDEASAAETGGTDHPAGFRLHGNYPNPFNGETTIEFSLPAASWVQVAVTDLLGKRVLELDAGSVGEGRHGMRIRARALASGVYVYTLRSRFGAQTRTFMLLK